MGGNLENLYLGSTKRHHGVETMHVLKKHVSAYALGIVVSMRAIVRESGGTSGAAPSTGDVSRRQSDGRAGPRRRLRQEPRARGVGQGDAAGRQGPQTSGVEPLSVDQMDYTFDIFAWRLCN